MFDSTRGGLVSAVVKLNWQLWLKGTDVQTDSQNFLKRFTGKVCLRSTFLTCSFKYGTDTVKQGSSNDSTDEGGVAFFCVQAYRDGGAGVLRPVALRLGGSPTPGLTEGLQQALEGMTVGGTRTVTVPPGLGFGTGGSLAPYAFVPPGATLSYSVELLRLSTVGPDNLMSVGGGTGGGKRMAGRGY